MSASFRCYGKPGTTEVLCAYYEDDFVPAEGSVLMDSGYPITRPERFGDWYVTQAGGYIWVAYPDPPFPVVYHEGKLKNSDTLNEIPAESLPGQIQSRLLAVEAVLAGIDQAMTNQVNSAQQSAQQAQQSASAAG